MHGVTIKNTLLLGEKASLQTIVFLGRELVNRIKCFIFGTHKYELLIDIFLLQLALRNMSLGSELMFSNFDQVDVRA